MPKINLDIPLINRDGIPFKGEDAPLTLVGALLFSLEHKTNGQEEAHSMACYKLRKVVFKGGEVELMSEDITLLKKKCHEALSLPCFFAVVDLLEG